VGAEQEEEWYKTTVGRKQTKESKRDAEGKKDKVHEGSVAERTRAIGVSDELGETKRQRGGREKIK